MSQKYGGSYTVSPEVTGDPAVEAVIRERAWQEAERVGATERFRFEMGPVCDGMFLCPMNCDGLEDHEHDDWCDEPIEPHHHAFWAGYTA